MTMDATERDIDEQSPSVGDDFMNFVGALVRTHHRLRQDAGDGSNDPRQAKTARRAPRHERDRSQPRDYKDVS